MPRTLIVALLTLFISLAAATTSFSTTGQTVILNDIHYYVPSDVVGKLSWLGRALPLGLTPITVLPPASHVSTQQELAALAAKWETEDDVFQSGFLGALYLQGNMARNHSRVDYGPGVIVVRSLTLNTTTIPCGPYFVTSTGTLHQAYKLYSDVQGAFTETSFTGLDGSHYVLPANLPGQSLAVAVPSRLYFAKTIEKPLAGLRLGVKDIYNIAGLKTSNGNRAWYHLYPAANKTALPVQNLIEAGAVVVGKMKTSQFANGETATADWVDYHSPFNPRGDGYQDGSSSSTGPGAGEGAYEWLDFTLGSDTGGSVRGPSAAQGLFGNRPTWGLVELDNTMPLAPQLDTAGLLTRDPKIWSAAAKALYKENVTFTSLYPSNLLTLDFPPSNSTDDYSLTYLRFLSKLSRFLGGARVSAFDIATSWAVDNPSSAPLSELLNTTYALMIAKEQTRLVRDPFYADYAIGHGGREPFVDPVPISRWGYGDTSAETIEQAVANKTTFMDWFNSRVLAPDAETCSNSLMLYPTGGSTTYRNEYRDLPGVPLGFATSRISVMAEVPDMVVPIGQTAYNSTITKHVEYLPLTVDFMAAKGCDGMIFSLVEELLDAGIVDVSKAGMSSTDGGDVLYKRW
ncbi:amidase signature enzyme [Pseudovirgaria hyperparasitica]|uniref:Amidase signature enzyme n=1 Tax=Pseudovirgaria hyperparasitica TaxID=470096 RepID=A0A6A6W648_9PEZI|nr:amidase signature enzyme [Pseudovirgaria hyperparasitica]KAF2758352.1 amidase signature enzyme [Pseudovirgaria hyperparasitica]